jgi:hypothetical protein
MCYLVDCFVNFEKLPENLKMTFKAILLDYRKTFTSEGLWENFLTGRYFAAGVRHKIRVEYGL